MTLDYLRAIGSYIVDSFIACPVCGPTLTRQCQKEGVDPDGVGCECRRLYFDVVGGWLFRPDPKGWNILHVDLDGQLRVHELSRIRHVPDGPEREQIVNAYIGMICIQEIIES